MTWSIGVGRSSKTDAGEVGHRGTKAQRTRCLWRILGGLERSNIRKHLAVTISWRRLVMITCRPGLARLAAAAIVMMSAPSPAPRAQAPARHPITFADMERLERIADTQISPDGKSVVYQVT